MTMSYDVFDTPIGPLTVVCNEHAELSLLLLPKEGRAARFAPEWELAPRRLREIRAQLEDYFAGKRLSFDMPLALAGTPFQRAVWNGLLEIAYGDTISYAELARRLDNPSAVRAVGAANGANPIAIIVPCHRVIGANGSLTGYGSGLPAKRWLIEHERRHAPAPVLELRS